jgi:hypothetical protein
MAIILGAWRSQETHFLLRLIKKLKLTVDLFRRKGNIYNFFLMNSVIKYADAAIRLLLTNCLHAFVSLIKKTPGKMITAIYSVHVDEWRVSCGSRSSGRTALAQKLFCEWLRRAVAM